MSTQTKNFAGLWIVALGCLTFGILYFGGDGAPFQVKEYLEATAFVDCFNRAKAADERRRRAAGRSELEWAMMILKDENSAANRAYDADMENC